MDRDPDIPAPVAPDAAVVRRWLELPPGPACERFLTRAGAERDRTVGGTVYLRGLIEFSNRCERNCTYCGIRRGNPVPVRYCLEPEQIVAAARRADALQLGSIVLQAGERRDPAFTAFVGEVLERLHAATGGRLTVTLSLGEQSAATYRRWAAAGAHRYLLRLETGPWPLYRRLHPGHPDWQARRRCLDRLREAGYQVGTGLLGGLPGQTPAMLAEDLLLLRNLDVDMIGLGPYIPHPGTPLGAADVGFDPAERLVLGLKMIAAARLLLPEVNIAAATALEALAADGRERGLRAGANVVMPNLTPDQPAADYQLYPGKPAPGTTPAALIERLTGTITAAGGNAGFGQAGDSLRYRRRCGAV